MIYCFQFFNQYGFCIGNISECDRALLEIALSHLIVDKFVDKLPDGLLCIIWQ